MGNFFMIYTVLKSNFWNLFSDFSYAPYIILSLIVFIPFLLLVKIVYKKVRRKFPLRVNCWFCNNNTTVPYELSNCWDCPHCKQYNGFNKDGGYNKIIPEQFNHKLNENVFTTFKTENSDNSRQTNGLCKLCNINQQLKIQQLALFVPLDESNYNKEIEQYREKLEKAYKLCSKCEKTLQETLQRQEYNLLTNRLNSHKLITLSEKLRNVDKFGGRNILSFIKKNAESGLKLVCIIVSILLVLALLNHYETENQLLSFALPDFLIVQLPQPILKMLVSYLEMIYSLKRELSFAGLVFWFLADLNRQLRKNYVCLVVWGFLHMSVWTALTGPQVLLSGICLLLSIRATHKRFIYLSKKSPPKSMGFQPIKKVFPEVYSTLGESSLDTNGGFSSFIQNENFSSLNKENELYENKIKEAEQKFTGMSDAHERKKKMRKRENEIESLPNEEKEKTESKSPNSSLNSSCNSKSVPSFMDSDKNIGESQGPFSEVYNTLNSLHIGDKQKKPNKPSNFLFSNSNFSEVKNLSSIIKPAKLIKNLNSSSWTESNECNSRSSTPSSGYSSQKPEKSEPNRYDFPKTMTPLSVNSFTRLSPNNYFDHYDSNHLFYNNMNCFSSGFVPFQQYPGPMGHTTIYTCTRPNSFPFPYSPCQGFPPQKFSPGSSRFSDASDCYNLFQDSSKSFERNKRWSCISGLEATKVQLFCLAENL